MLRHATLGVLSLQRYLIVVLVLAAVAAVAACSPEPTPTPTPTATATPTPTPAPTPTPTPRAMVAIEDLELTDTSTMADIAAALSDDEVTCLREAIGPETFDLLLNVPLSTLPGETSDFPLQCLSPESAIGISIAFMSAEAGGLSVETRSCISGLAMENPSVLGIGEPPTDPAALFGTAVQMQLCMTDEEAQRLMGGDQGIPSPSALRCLEEELGGLEAVLAIFSGQEPDPDAMLALFAAAQKCDAEIMPGGVGGGGG